MMKPKKGKQVQYNVTGKHHYGEPESMVATECAKKCIELEVSCPNSDCRNWMNYEEEMNCAVISAYVNGPMTLREIGERLSISFVRVKQLEGSGLVKIKKRTERFELSRDYI